MGALPASTRFFAPKITKIWFLPTIASAALAATRAEITAGTDLSSEVADMSGWNVGSEQIATPGLSAFTGSVPGRKTVDASSITFYADKLGADVRAVLTEDLDGFILIADAGDIPTTGKMDVFPIRVASVGKARHVTGSTAHQLTATFSITRPPAADVAIPAAV